MSSRAASDVIRGNNDIIRASILMLKLDPKYRMTTAMIDSIISVLQTAEKAFKDEPSIDLVGCYAETVDLVSQLLIRHEMHHMAQMIVGNSEIIKKEGLKSLFSA